MQSAAAIYVRRSREIKGTKDRPSGVSREQQEASCRGLAAANGERVDSVLVDWDISGRKGEDKRPGFAELMDLVRGAGPCPTVQKGREKRVQHHPTRGRIASVYAYDLSRIARNTSLLKEVFDEADAHGVTVRLVKDSIDTSTATGRMVRGIIAEIAQWQSDVASERSLALVEKRRADGQRIGHPNYGERPGEDLPAVLRAYQDAGSILGAARLLNERSVPSRMGKPWASTTVREILVREGAAPKRSRPGAKARAPFAFYGLLRCHCGHILTGTRYRNGSDPVYTTYKCHMARTVPNHGLGAVPEKRVLAWAAGEAARLELPGDELEVSARNDAERERLEAKRARIIDSYVDGTITSKDERDRRLVEVDDAMEVLDDVVTVVRVEPIDWTWPPEALNAWLRSVFVEVQMDTTMQPLRAEWRVPEWRA